MDSRWVSEKIFQGEISRRVPKRHPSHSFQFALSREFYCPLPFTFHPAFMPSYLPTASHGLSSACPPHATHSVTTPEPAHTGSHAFWRALSTHTSLHSRHILVPEALFPSSWPAKSAPWGRSALPSSPGTPQNSCLSPG